MEKAIPAWGLYRLLKALERKRFSGQLELRAAVGRASLGFDDGRIFRVETDVPEWAFPAYLVRARIVPDALKAERMTSAGMLVESGVIRREDGARLQASYLRSVLTLMMSEPFPVWGIDRTPMPAGTLPDMPVEPEPELMRAVGRRDIAEVRAVVDRLVESGSPVLGEGAEPCLRYARAQFGDLRILQYLRDDNVEDAADALLAEEGTARVLFSLHVAGHLSFQPRPAPAHRPEPAVSVLVEAQAPAPTLDSAPASASGDLVQSDVEARLVEAAARMADQNNYEILEVSIDARLSAIRMAWLRMRRQWVRTRFEGVVSAHAMTLLDGIHKRLEAARERLSERNARLQYNRAIDIATPGLEARLVEVFEAQALHQSGREALANRDAKAAMASFEAAWRQDPLEPLYLVAMAEALMAMPPSDETRARVRELLGQAFAVDADLIEAHLAMAEVLRREQDWDGSMDHVRRVLLLEPENSDASRLRDRLRKRPADAVVGGFQRKPGTLLGKVRSLLRGES